MGIRVGGMLGGVTGGVASTIGGAARTIGGAVGAAVRPGATPSSFTPGLTPPTMGMSGGPVGMIRAALSKRIKGKTLPGFAQGKVETSIGAPAAAPADKTLKIRAPFSGSPDGRVY